jgi:hypothetical protein
MLLEVQIFDHGRQVNHDVYARTDIDLVTRNNVVLGADGPADDVTAFKHGDFVTGFGQVRGAGERIVPATNHEGIVASIRSIHWLEHNRDGDAENGSGTDWGRSSLAYAELDGSVRIPDVDLIVRNLKVLWFEKENDHEFALADHCFDRARCAGLGHHAIRQHP